MYFDHIHLLFLPHPTHFPIQYQVCVFFKIWIFLRQSLPTCLCLSWNSLYKPGWPQTHRNLQLPPMCWDGRSGPLCFLIPAAPSPLSPPTHLPFWNDKLPSLICVAYVVLVVGHTLENGLPVATLKEDWLHLPPPQSNQLSIAPQVWVEALQSLSYP